MEAPPAAAAAAAPAPPVPVADVDALPVLDAAREAAILRALVPMSSLKPAGASGRKRARKERKAAQPCYSWVRDGSCKWGNKCRFGHPPKEEQAQQQQEGEDDDEAAEGGAAGDDDGPSAAGAASAGASVAADGTAAATSGAASGSSSAPAAAAAAAPSSSPPPVGSGGPLDRYFYLHYAPDVCGVRGNDVVVGVHSNRNVAMLCLSPAHPVLRLGLDVARVEFGTGRAATGDLLPLTDVTPSGKGKKGQAFLLPDTVVATVHTACGRAYRLSAGITAGVVEVNDRLLTAPQLLTTRPRSDGFLALLMFKQAKLPVVTAALLPRERYADLLRARGLAGLADVVAGQGRPGDVNKAGGPGGVVDDGGE
jgi:glycine cleavage system H lipoate-binding protein